jgi:hypothetical protein
LFLSFHNHILSRDIHFQIHEAKCVEHFKKPLKTVPLTSILLAMGVRKIPAGHYPIPLTTMAILVVKFSKKGHKIR